MCDLAQRTWKGTVVVALILADRRAFAWEINVGCFGTDIATYVVDPSTELQLMSDQRVVASKLGLIFM